jgi:S1-C subfamily serine protease
MLMALALPARAATDERSAQLYYTALNASGWVNRKTESGAGCLVDRANRLMLTNYHVVKEDETVVVMFPVFVRSGLVTDRNFYFKNRDHLAVRARVLYRDKTRDLALIHLNALPARAVALKLADELPEPGDQVFRVGSPGAKDQTWHQDIGKVRAVAKANLTYPSKQHVIARAVFSDLPGTPGHSGSAVLNSRGELVAIHAAQQKSNLLSVSIDVNEVRAFLREARESLTASR